MDYNNLVHLRLMLNLWWIGFAKDMVLIKSDLISTVICELLDNRITLNENWKELRDENRR